MQKTQLPECGASAMATRMGKQGRRRGSVWLVPTAPQDEGAALTATIPQTSGALALVEEPEFASVAVASRAAPCVLIVEDDPQIAGMLRRAFELEGRSDWTVDIIADGLAALTRAQESIPDIVLLDVRLPDIDGAEVYRRLRAAPGTRDCHVVFLTASTSLDLSVRGVDGGILLRKPFDIESVIELVGELLRA